MPLKKQRPRLVNLVERSLRLMGASNDLGPCNGLDDQHLIYLSRRPKIEPSPKIFCASPNQLMSIPKWWILVQDNIYKTTLPHLALPSLPYLLVTPTSTVHTFSFEGRFHSPNRATIIFY